VAARRAAAGVSAAAAPPCGGRLVGLWRALVAGWAVASVVTIGRRPFIGPVVVGRAIILRVVVGRPVGGRRDERQGAKQQAEVGVGAQEVHAASGA
jgi:hypothetical protein